MQVERRMKEHALLHTTERRNMKKRIDDIERDPSLGCSLSLDATEPINLPKRHRTPKVK